MNNAKADIPTQDPVPQEHPRFQGAYAHARGTAGAEAPPAQGSRAPDGVGPGRRPVALCATTTMLPRQHRLTRKASFDAVFANGRRWTGQHVTIRTLHNGTDAYRCGLSVSKAVGNAVVRNRVKRRLREIIRGANVRPGYDVVVVARPSAAAAPFKGLRADLAGLLRRARVSGAPAEQGVDR